MLLSAEHLSINFGSRQLLEDVSLFLNEGDKVGIIGINGTGKSTLLRLLAGDLTPDSGTISRNPNVQVGYLPQNPVMDDEATVLEQVFLHMPDSFRALNEYEAKAMLNRLGIGDFGQRVGTLSGGQRKRVALAAVLLHPADVLVLDEPTNHLDSEMVAWLEQRLARFSGALIMVTHDRYFLERVANHITEVSRGKLYHYEANYSKYLELKEQRQEMERSSERKRQSILRTEREWIMRGCRARSTKSKDRIQRYEELRDRSAPEADSSVQMASASARLGRKIIELSHVSKAFDGRTVIRDFSYGVGREDRIGIVGRNGVGKSTLLRLIAGDLEPDSGAVERGATVKIGYFSQEGRELDLNQRVYDFIHEIAEEVKTEEGTFSASQMMERFLFPADLQSVAIGQLSGGERRRLYLLSILMSSPNVLLFDEPTNDLDVTTLAILEDYLDGFSGPVLAVSHDRYFLDRIATSMFEIRPEGELRRYSGNYSDYVEKRVEEDAAKERPERAEAPRERRRKLKFSYQEQREYETIEARIADLEEQLRVCAGEMELCGSDYVRLQELQSRQEELSGLLDQVMERWMYLSDLAERIEAQQERSF
ncbi:ABC-F family ATP-binding cassette domain-containing protein [Oscillibacter hominis]|uniref:ABC-F family ATP-binding cassette domain-containing protein n=1 Tax=Oscillibacter hominis TaxID=2763056 RepID=A0A7G9B6S4_9FIRM|nr:ABC-F family ATP-binding cassette domain-containing protein [Oscillibacter hominis]QNL45255.1 ABC-F family ATP-binding cassette domain-containing protein [Oscillibacter hominis]